MKLKHFIRTLLMIGMIAPLLVTQQAPKPLTNDDVITMVKGGMPESVVVTAIQSRQGKFSTSTSELVRLHKAGVTENELNAMIAASSKGNSNPIPTSNAEPSAAVTPKSRMPHVSVTANGNTRDLPLEKTQLAETKTKPSSLKVLAGDSAVTQAMQAGINTASYSAASHIGSAIGSSSVQQAGGVLSSIMSHRQPKMTYVWGVPGPASATVLQSASPAFSVDFSRALGVQPDDYEPTIVKLTPAQNTCRILGATEGKEDIRSSPASDWQVYAHFLEERVKVQPQKLGPGKYNISPASELAPGEYALVLRPLSKTKTFSGGDVARAQGDGLMCDATWTFQISEDAQ
jgi:hypothetical protein